MSRERKREVKEIAEKGIAIAEPGGEVIWNDPKLKTSFISNPFISRLKGRATLEQMLAYNLYFDDLTQKWKPLSDITISTVKNLGRYYPVDPDPPTVLSDLYLRVNDKHHLYVFDKLSRDELIEIKAFNTGKSESNYYSGMEYFTINFPDINIPWTAVDLLLDVTSVAVGIVISVFVYSFIWIEVFNENFTTVDTFKRRVIFPSSLAVKVAIQGTLVDSFANYMITGLHLPLEVPITT